MTSVAIMQPTFIPWLGYFALMELSDYFVVLDDVQFAKQSWQSRNQLKGPNGIVRISLSIKRKPSLPLISEVQIAEVGYSEKLVKSVQGCLGTAPHWRVVQNILQEGLSHPEQSLLKVNLTFIKIISNLLGIECKFCLSSSIGFTGLEKSNRLLKICESLKADVYYSPVGSAEYLKEVNAFEGSNVNLRFLNFTHPQYVQRWGAFSSNMSILDVIAWNGLDQTKELLLSGIGESLCLDEVL
jgi:hypothetical protein